MNRVPPWEQTQGEHSPGPHSLARAWRALEKDAPSCGWWAGLRLDFISLRSPAPPVPHTACTTFSNCCVGSQIGLGSCWFKQVFFSTRSPWANMLHFELPRGECGIFCDGPQNSFFVELLFLRIQVEKNWTRLSVPVLVSLRLCSHLRYFIPFLSLNKNWSPHYHHHQHHHTISKLHLQLSIPLPQCFITQGCFCGGHIRTHPRTPPSQNYVNWSTLELCF